MKLVTSVEWLYSKIIKDPGGVQKLKYGFQWEVLILVSLSYMVSHVDTNRSIGQPIDSLQPLYLSILCFCTTMVVPKLHKKKHIQPQLLQCPSDKFQCLRDWRESLEPWIFHYSSWSIAPLPQVFLKTPQEVSCILFELRWNQEGYNLWQWCYQVLFSLQS